MTDDSQTLHPGTPPRDCPLCPRLVAYRAEQQARHPTWWNAPVPPMGDARAWLAIIGLAPGLKGANRLGLPFHGDDSGRMLFGTLASLGLAQRRADSGDVDLWNAPEIFISDAVACVPPGNLPETSEKHNCRPYLATQLAHLPNLRVIVALGATAHQAAVKAVGGKLPKYRFEHGAVHRLPSGILLIDSYHCSRLNTNTGLLTPEMFTAAFQSALAFRSGSAPQ
jgi:uracil-DNA glycosylase family 4